MVWPWDHLEPTRPQDLGSCGMEKAHYPTYVICLTIMSRFYAIFCCHLYIFSCYHLYGWEGEREWGALVSWLFCDFLLCLWCNVSSAIGMESINHSIFLFKFLKTSAFYMISAEMRRVQYYFYLILFSFICLYKNLMYLLLFLIL